MKPFAPLLTLLLLITVAVSSLTGCAARTASQAPVSASQAESPEPEMLEAQPQWFACKTDADCEAVEGVCRNPTSVNRAFTAKYLKFRDMMNTMVRCTDHPVSLSDFKPLCRKRRCAVDPAK